MINLKADIHSILDIGANVGNWTAAARKTWPDARFLMIEANAGCVKALRATGEPYLITLLGKERKASVPFYVLGDTATGASIYREIGTELYKDVEPVGKMQSTLDHLLPTGQFDLIKIDTQGSELDILSGGMELVKRAKAIWMEVSFLPYNEGAPLVDEVTWTLCNVHGFPFYRMMNLHAEVNQADYLFTREKIDGV